MNWDIFQDPHRRFSVVVFLQDSDLEHYRGKLEQLGKQRNVKVVVQPCPYEGIEFLCRTAHDFIGHHVSVEKDFFWHAIEVKPETPTDIFTNLSDQHHQYLCAILEQDPKKVRKSASALEALSPHFSRA